LADFQRPHSFRSFDFVWKLELYLRVARWYIFKPKIPIWVNFGGPWNGKGWYIIWPFGIHYGHLEYIIKIQHLLGLTGIYILSASYMHQFFLNTDYDFKFRTNKLYKLISNSTFSI
jgi:hypothetical protein